jgi:hypothetical protein
LLDVNAVDPLEMIPILDRSRKCSCGNLGIDLFEV